MSLTALDRVARCSRYGRRLLEAQPQLAEAVAARNVDDVGLLRAEFMVAQIGEHPRHMIDQGRGQEFVNKLADGIGIFAKAFNPRPVVYRTNDFKTNEYAALVRSQFGRSDNAAGTAGHRFRCPDAGSVSRNPGPCADLQPVAIADHGAGP